jgi:hypothetical protein
VFEFVTRPALDAPRASETCTSSPRSSFPSPSRSSLRDEAESTEGAGRVETGGSEEGRGSELGWVYSVSEGGGDTDCIRMFVCT